MAPGDQTIKPEDEDDHRSAQDDATIEHAIGHRAPGQPPQAAAGASTSGRGGLEKAGDQIGAYKLLSLIGEGGFGTVWLAERREPFVQRVALKLIKAGMDSKSVLARFEQERQALAVMNHPNIARVLDGGITPAGRPYFAMEFVKGEPVTQFCDRMKLDIEERLKLFQQACEAIQHAHLKGIVHRDLKPGNILAFMVEGEGPKLKVIDFGVAKAMSQRMTEHTIFTETGQMIGTPEYMSPEQADPTAGDIDTRSDIYSLGVLLYELLVGATPFDAKELRKKAYGEIQRTLREQDPPSPSARLSTLSTKDRDAASRIEASRKLRAGEIVRRLRGELEWIPLKAMRKEPQHRYQTAIALAEDVRNYLEGKPLVAAPESTGYRVRKYVRRNKALVTGVAAVALALVAGLSLATWQWRVAVAQRAEAEQARDAERIAKERAEERERDVQNVIAFQIQQMSEFGGGDTGSLVAKELMRQIDVLAASMPDQAAREALVETFRSTLRSLNMTDVASALVTDAMLERAAQRADRDYANAPFLRAGLLMATGRAFHLLGKYERAGELFEKAANFYLQSVGADDRRTLAAREWAARTDTDFEASERELRDVLARRESLFGADAIDTLESRRALGDLLALRGENRKALEELERVMNTDDLALELQLLVAASVGDLQSKLGDSDGAVRTLDDARIRVEKLRPIPQRLHANILTNLGLALVQRERSDRHAEGIEMLRQALLIEVEFYGAMHPNSFASRGNLASGHQRTDDGSGGWRIKAAELLEESRRLGSSVVAPPDEYFINLVELAVIRIDLATETTDLSRQDLGVIVAMAEDAVRLLDARRVYTEPALFTRKNLAYILRKVGRAAEAEQILRQVRARWIANDGPSSIGALNVALDLADSLLAQKSVLDAATVLQEAQDAKPQRKATSDARWNVAINLRNVLRTLVSSNSAGPWATRLREQEAEVQSLTAERVAAGLDVSALEDPH